jgi:SAM-dependent methyltransferase
MSSTTDKPWREESDAWKNAYRDSELIQRRSVKHRKKLDKLGVLNWPKNSCVLDVCCGTGEVLKILKADGFTDLSGVDVTIDPELKATQGLRVAEGSSTGLPYGNEIFDNVICMHSLHLFAF